MRIGLISDTHGDPVAWERALEALGRVDLVLHAGDVLYHGVFNPVLDTYNPRRLAELLNGYPVPMVHARGNCDSEVDQLALHNHILSEFAFVSAEGTRILVTHGHKQTPEELAEMGRRSKVHMVHRGHTHQPELTVVNGVMLVNAGSCALPKQEGEVPSVGVLEDGKIAVLDTSTGERLMEEGLPG